MINTIDDNSAASPTGILSFYFAVATLSRYNKNGSLVSYIDGSLSWTEKKLKSYDPDNSNNALNYLANDSSKFVFSQTAKDTSTANPDNYVTSSNESLKFSGKGGERLAVTSKVSNASAVSSRDTATSSSASDSLDISSSYSFTYSEGGQTRLKTDDVKVTYSDFTKTSTKNISSNSDTNTSLSSSSRSQETENTGTAYTYSDGTGYKFSFKTNYNYSNSRSSSSYDNFQTGASSSSDKDNTVSDTSISALSYADAFGNVFKLTAKAAFSENLTANGNLIDTSFALINGMTLTTSEIAITSGKISLNGLGISEDLSIILDKIDISTLSIDTVFSQLQANFLDLILAGNNTITVRDKSAGHEVNGGGGNDMLKGNVGDDILKGESGSDKLVGGKGADTFVFAIDDYDFSAAKIDADWITDFKHKEGDQIDLSSFGGILGFYKSLTDAKTAQTGETLIYERSTGKIFYDADGFSSDAGGEAAALIITVTGKPPLAADDFIV